MDWLWQPDILLYNSVDREAMSWKTGQIYLYNDGTVWYSATAVVVISCTYDVRKFPFDTQTCSPLFASWSFADYELNISSVQVETNDASFNNLAWKVDSVVASREVITQWEVYNFSFGIFYITISRHSNYYITSIIMPTLIVTGIVISGLFMSNVYSRLSLGITGLLTVIAIQVSA
jgi:nicotinic acetylcholine receptor, invertebrate